MDLIWILFAMPIAGLLYFVYVLGKRESLRLPDCVVPLSLSAGTRCGRFRSFEKGRRAIRWVSTDQLEALMRRCDDVLLIDLRPDAPTGRLPLPAEHAFSVEPNHLLDVLQWVPSETIVVLCGATNLSVPMMWAVRSLSGFAPVYVLDEDPIRSEVA